MKGKITQGGCLVLWRGTAYVPQICPEAPDFYPCGHWCPRFGEPDKTFAGGHVLRICSAELRFDDFTDERGKA